MWLAACGPRVFTSRIGGERTVPASIPDADVDRLFDTYDTVLTGIADRMVPLHTTRRRRGRLAPWFDTECRLLRRECRRLERRYRPYVRS